MSGEKRVIAYFRVSTTKQGASGLGIEAQRAAVSGYLSGSEARVVAEFIEIESGTRKDRPALEQALTFSRLHRVPLVVAKVDRLTRSVGFMSRLIEAGVDVRFADLPALEGPTGRFMLQQMAAVAELEAGLISNRTKAALAAAKARGVVLGGNRGVVISTATRAAGTRARIESAKLRAMDIAPVLTQLQSEGVTSAIGIARALTERGIPTPRGHTVWSATQVIRTMAKLQ